ncbi:hypothetical protein LT679_13000 [Mucilaginibacter roseus]|uniref:Uncharacterized protein n=1 Tax=Mucilaginibacter roseus TaxID=1528868 RepID=A0ABS8U779_9SPHI|nr:hypothetical protein [Mucilaginibacter roseus]MCD8741526.1 hypothetical protein [Mucilaginibacter roseus]
MKALIKYISLLLFSGLIIPLYYYYLPEKNNRVDRHAINAVTDNTSLEKTHTYLQKIAAELFPVIKKFD